MKQNINNKQSIMKKYIIIAAAAIAAMACSKVETIDTPAQKVTFEVANYVPQTKATSLEGEGFTTFKCNAYLHAEGINLNASYETSQAGDFQDFFDNTETVKLNGDTNSSGSWDSGETFVWKTDQDYYWPKSTHSFVNFVAWIGTTGTPTVGYAWDTTESAYKATIAWPFTSTVGTATQNLLYADMAWRFHNNINPAQNAGVSHVTEGVPMLFHHLLSKICVKAYAVEATATPANPTIGTGTGSVSDGTATWTITFEDLSIGSVYTAGTINLSNVDPGTGSNVTQGWTQDAATSTTSGNLTLANGANAISHVTANTADVIIDETCVLPQTIGNTVVLSGKVNIHTAYGNGAANDEKLPFSFNLNTMGTAAWAQNTRYTYIIKVNPAQKKVYFDPAVAADYTNVTATEQTI